MGREDVARRLESLSWAFVLSVVAVAPLLTTNLTGFGIAPYPFTHDQIELPRAMLVHAASWAALAAWAFSRVLVPASLRVHRSWLVWVGFMTMVTISTAASPDLWTSLLGDYRRYEGLTLLCAYGVLAFVTMQLANRRRLRWLARWMTITGALVSLYAVWQIAGLDTANWLSGASYNQAFSTWGNSTYLGGYLLFPLAFSVPVALAEERRIWRSWGWFALAANFLGLIASGTRGAWVAAFVMGLLMLWRVSGRPSVWIRALAGTAALGAASIAITNAPSKSAILERATTVNNLAGGSGRFRIWHDTLPLIARHPLLGTGPDSLASAIASYYQVTRFNDAHNWPLQMAVTVGIPTAILLYVFLTWVLVDSRSSAFPASRDPGRLTIAATWIAATGYLVHLMFGLSIITSSALLFICLGALIGVASKRSAALDRAATLVIGVAAGVLVVCAIVLGVRAVAADHAYLQARIAVHEGGDHAEWARRAVEINPINDRYRQELEGASPASE